MWLGGALARLAFWNNRDLLNPKNLPDDPVVRVMSITCRRAADDGMLFVMRPIKQPSEEAKDGLKISLVACDDAGSEGAEKKIDLEHEFTDKFIRMRLPAGHEEIGAGTVYSWSITNRHGSSGYNVLWTMDGGLLRVKHTFHKSNVVASLIGYYTGFLLLLIVLAHYRAAVANEMKKKQATINDILHAMRATADADGG